MAPAGTAASGRIAAALVAALVTRSATAQQPSGPCKFDFGNSSFDLTPFQAQNYYRVQDSQNNKDSKNFSYYFNVCKDVDPSILPGGVPSRPPPGDKGASYYCSATGPGGWSPTSPKVRIGPAPAFQYSEVLINDADQCHALGAPVASTAPVFGLVDPTNPSRGVSITFPNGDSCGSSYGNRSLRLWLVCDPDITNVPDSEPVVESNTCAYEIFVTTAYGCPRECPIAADPVSGQKGLCSNHGLCSFDAALKNSRCFCNTGWSGSECNVKPGSGGGLSAVGGILVAVGVFLIITLAFLGYLWLRIRSLRLDPAAYSSLRAGPDDSGMVGGSDLKGPGIGVN